MIDLVYFRMNFYYNLSQNVFPKYKCFCKKYLYFFPNIVIFSQIRNDIDSNFVERINEWFSAKDIRFMEKMVQSTLHIWINSHIFQNNTIFMK